MTEISIFDFETHPLRVVMLDEQPHWVAGDLAACLAYNHTPNMLRMLDDDQKGAHLVNTLGGDQSLSIVTEGGMWTCVLRSKRPEAKRFVRWLTDVLLPTLRRTGTFTMPGHEVDHGAHPLPQDNGRYRLDLDAVALMRRLAGNGAALGLWARLGLPLPDGFGHPAALDDGLAAAIAVWSEGKDRFTTADLAQGCGIYEMDTITKRRITDILTGAGWIYKKAAHQKPDGSRTTISLWHRPAMKHAAGVVQ
jgi:BRO family, N-terminal domain